jgi:predicted negative regulator of RcsB-dependent stress response
LSRHELKAQDEITSTIQRVTELAYKWKKEILTAVAAVAVLIVAIGAWYLYSANRNAKAQEQLSAAITFYTDPSLPERERYEKTLAEASRTYETYASTPIGPIANYYVAMSREGLGDTAGAIQTLQEVTATGDEAIRSVAQFALGVFYKMSGEYV